MEGGGLSPRHLARTAPGLLRLGQYLSPLSPRPRPGISPPCSPECEGSRWEQPQQAEDAVTGRSPGVVSGWRIHGQSEPVAPGVQQGKAGPGSLARRPRGAWMASAGRCCPGFCGGCGCGGDSSVGEAPVGGLSTPA